MYLRDRVEKGEELPEVEIQRPSEGNEEGVAEQEKLRAVVRGALTHLDSEVMVDLMGYVGSPRTYP